MGSLVIVTACMSQACYLLLLDLLIFDPPPELLVFLAPSLELLFLLDPPLEVFLLRTEKVSKEAAGNDRESRSADLSCVADEKSFKGMKSDCSLAAPQDPLRS
ncbi:hypothetical protein F2Q68_00014899 [Brassica cretica]|uniref:Uncharacterized protein n=1 Tax=Brassica cretica TaxID=69181 RepID=A0A8S9HCT1_BRACR|nr:hypothetical protein F2Q68_00014899 [Brassica cretica]